VSKGNEIVVSAQPLGHWDEGIISGTPLPGTLMMISAGVAPVNGRFTWQELNIGGQDQEIGLIAVLDMDSLQGKGQADAYVSGTYGKIYFPLAGDELNLRIGEAAGTANWGAIGDYYHADADNGMLVPESGTASTAARIAQLLEKITALAPNSLAWFKIVK
jgi:hypothetical protein